MKGAPAVVLEDVAFAYGATPVLRGIDVELHEGELVALVGPNGAGKSTMLRLIAGLARPTGGRILLRGAPLDPEKPESRAQIGYAPQRSTLWLELTPREQLAFVGECYGFSPKEAHARATMALARVGLEDRADVRAKVLSGGMQQRVSVAMALVHDPVVLLFDEPDAGVDAPSLGQLYATLRAACASGKLVVFATHDAEAARTVAARTLRLEGGRIVADSAREAV